MKFAVRTQGLMVFLTATGSTLVMHDSVEHPGAEAPSTQTVVRLSVPGANPARSPIKPHFFLKPNPPEPSVPAC